MKLAAIAMLCHSINAAYCLSQGDESHLPWEQAPDELKKSIEYGVKLHLENPDTTPEQSHESWLKEKEAQGWTYGEVKDFEAKTHPCFKPYAELPAEQKAKDYLFKAVVNLTRDLPDPEDIQQYSAEILKLQRQIQSLKLQSAPQASGSAQAQAAVGVSIVYTARESWTDNLYGSQLVFKRGVPRTVPSHLAQKFLVHPEFQLVESVPVSEQESVQDDTAQILAEQEAKKKLAEQEDQIRASEIQAVNGFRSKDAVIKYVAERYKENLDPDLKLDQLKQIATDKIHQFGVV